MIKIKICGITNYEDAINAANLGVDYLGFNFYKYSPRYIEKSKAKKIIENLPKNLKKVGVFVNEDINKIKNIVGYCNIDLAQLSGDEDRDYVLNLKNIVHKRVIKSFRIRNRDDIKNIKDYKLEYVMLDSFKKGLYGGTGTKFDLRLAKYIEYIDKRRLFLAGGLNAVNVKSAINNIRPYAVDVCSSIEDYPGKKDLEKMREFIEAAK